MCVNNVNNLSKVALDSAAAGIELATSSGKSNAITMHCATEPRVWSYFNQWPVNAKLVDELACPRRRAVGLITCQPVNGWRILFISCE